MRAAARLLLIERDAIRPVLESAEAASFDLPTICTGWSVRDVLAHCAAALTMSASGNLHSFSPAENQRDVDERKAWQMRGVLDELYDGYEAAAGAIDRAGGALDGVGLGEWIHGGDVREPLGAPDPYASPGVDLAVQLLFERAAERSDVGITVTIDGARHRFGAGVSSGEVTTDPETFVRLTGGRRPDPTRFVAGGVDPGSLVLFS